MICMPGLTLVDLSAMSVSRLISMPGEISIDSEASPGEGQEALRDRAQERRVLGLQAVDE